MGKQIDLNNLPARSLAYVGLLSFRFQQASSPDDLSPHARPASTVTCTNEPSRGLRGDKLERAQHSTFPVSRTPQPSDMPYTNLLEPISCQSPGPFPRVKLAIRLPQGQQTNPPELVSAHAPLPPVLTELAVRYGRAHSRAAGTSPQHSRTPDALIPHE